MSYSIAIKAIEGCMTLLPPTLRAYLETDFEASAEMVENTPYGDADKQESWLYFEGRRTGLFCVFRGKKRLRRTQNG